MNNKEQIFVGIIISFISIFVLSGYLQYIWGVWFCDCDIEIGTSLLGITPVVNFNNNILSYREILFVFGRIITITLISEIMIGILRAPTSHKIKHSVIVAVLIQTGYIIVYLFYEMIAYFTNSNESNILNIPIKIWGLEENRIYVIILFIVIIIFSYLQIIQKRIMKYISPISGN